MEFRVLGPLEVRAGDGPLPLGGAKQRALLALLVLNANRVVARERLIDALWGEAPPESAVKGIQLYVWQLRKLLPEGTIVTRQDGYLLEVEPEGVDLVRFERLLAEARAAGPEPAARLLREALALWRGRALVGLGEEPFVRVEAGRLEDLRLVALEERIEADLAVGRHAELVGELEALIAEHPHRERPRGQLMLALYRSGRQAEALAAYRATRAALDELGLEPGAELKELEKQILTQDAALALKEERPLAPGGAPLPGPLVPTPPFPFVGRDGELTVLRSLLDRAERGEGGLVLLAAEAGGGKTRLIRELAHEAASRDVLVLYGASDAAVTTPYQPLLEWLEFLLRVCDPEALTECLGAAGGELARLVPELSPLTGAPAPERRDPASERFALQGAVTELLSRLSRRRPLLVVADDVHWADGETLHLLRRLARSAPEARWLVVAAYRSEENTGALADTIGDLGRLDGATLLTLANLGEEDVGEFIRRSTSAEAAVELVSAIDELTDGTPLLLCELWRELYESGGVEVAQTVRLTRPLDELRGPERIVELVRQRLARLDPETTALIELAAVAGPQFELSLLAAAADAEPATLAAALQEAVASGTIEELPEPALAHRFTHELVRRAVYDRVAGIRRAQLHLRVGEALEHVHAIDPGRVLAELAHHFTLAAPVAGAERAVEYNLRAAAAAIASATLEPAAECFVRALELGIADERERVRIQLELANVLAETGQPLRALALREDAFETVGRLGDRGLTAHARIALIAGYPWPRWDLYTETTQTTAEDAIEIFTELGDQRGLARARWRLAIMHNNDGRMAAGCAELEQALLHVEAAADPFLRSQIIGFLVTGVCVGPTPVDDAIRRCRELLRASSGDPVLEATIECGLFMLCAMAACEDEAREYGRESGEVLDQFGYHMLASSRRLAFQAQLLLGDAAAAEQQLLSVQESFGKGGATSRAAVMGAHDLALLYCDQGRWDEAERWLASGSEDPPAPHGTFVSLARPAVMARLAAHRGELDEALRLARDAVEVAEQTDRLSQRPHVWLGARRSTPGSRRGNGSRRRNGGGAPTLRAERQSRGGRSNGRGGRYAGPCFQAASIALRTSSIERCPVSRPIAFCWRASKTFAFHQLWLGAITYLWSLNTAAYSDMKSGICPWMNWYCVSPPVVFA